MLSMLGQKPNIEAEHFEVAGNTSAICFMPDWTNSFHEDAVIVTGTHDARVRTFVQ